MASDQLARTEFLTGSAGTGKSFTIQKRIEDDPGCAILCATTGVAAVNMSTVTINSILKYFNTEDLIDKYIRGSIHKHLRDLLSPYRPVTLVIDEVSMMHAEQLDTIYKAICEVNSGDDQHDPPKYPLGLMLTGDFCQLPPVDDKKMVNGKLKTIKAHWAFEAECWGEFAKTTTRLTKVWRQADPCFLEAVNAARSGNGPCAVANLRRLGVEFCLSTDMRYDGTTIIPKNDEVDRYNTQRLLQIREPSFEVQARRWGYQQGDWRNVPDRAFFKPGALVMLLANKRYPIDDFEPHDSPYQYVNGDLAHVVQYCESSIVRVVSLRTGEEFFVPPVLREHTLKAGPDDINSVMEALAGFGAKPSEDYRPVYDEVARRWVVGTIQYSPMRLGYASTVHKTQGLSLDRVQIDCRDGFFGQPSMAYVALSRVRSAGGMRIVGTPDLLTRRIKFNEEVREWL